MYTYTATTLEKVTDYDEICGSLSMEEAINYATGLALNVADEDNFYFSYKEFHRYSPYRWCVLRVKK